AREILAGGDGVAGLGQNFGDLQARPIRADHGFLARDDDARRLDNGGGGEIRCPQHPGGGALWWGLPRLRLLGRKGGSGEGEHESGGREEREGFSREGLRIERVHGHPERPFFKAWISAEAGWRHRLRAR